MKYVPALKEAIIAAQMEQFRKDSLAAAALQRASDEKEGVKKTKGSAPKPA